ncbi:two-component system sensor histidine kinase RppB [Rivularia sp. UHCC 0363]|uniref:two-component system sensor histidine kinase RppB n=1 Tax=Rivularia sp. UHCC 0363 TaxID=3110244 RepID=UPI002B20641A|nr:two-component system sensor histidine kinase RppB [Rivularia sp. UHCC 0363]MEA5594085.1 two-component system sensor histidine kinase RppB [Rivularia sp. UHCC 0363]
MQIRVFNKTRWRLAAWYGAAMGLFLSLCGIAIYQVMIRAYLVSIDRELEAVTGTLYSVIEPTLQQPKRLEPIFQVVLPNLCVPDSDCSTTKIPNHIQRLHSQHGIFSTFYQDKIYYVRFIDTSGKLIAVAGFDPEELPQSVQTKGWQTLKDGRGIRYSQKSLSMHTQNNQLWGYIQVGRSLKELDNRLAAFKLILAFGFPITILLVGGSSWWLAGLAMRPINRSYKQMQQFTSDVSHELRTPLAAVNAKVETVLESSELSEQQARDVLTSVKRQNLRLVELVQDLLLLSRLEQQTLMPKKQPCSLNILIEDLIEEFSALANASSLQLEYSILSHQPLYVMGDEDQLLRLLSNLIANAIQYTPTSGNINLILKKNNGDAVIEVIDTGIGISPQEQQVIFDRFYRVNSSRSRRSGGSGLGLAIAQVIAQAHGGKIQVQSQLGKGSTFSVRLPLKVIPASHL